jgi:hypothetical protein
MVVGAVVPILERAVFKRCCVSLGLTGMLVAGLALARPSAVAEPAASNLSRALVSTTDMPSGWSPYVPRPADSFRRTKGVCGQTSPARDTASNVAYSAFTANNATGPVFGERIEQHTTAAARATMKRNRQRPYPCKWGDVGYRWTARTIPESERSGLFAYLQTKRPGTFTYSYQFLARRGGVIIAMVASCSNPCQTLGNGLARKALHRYDDTMSTTA